MASNEVIWSVFSGRLTRGGKNVTEKKAQDPFPELREKTALWNADALLIAEYGRRRLAHMRGSKRKRTA